VLAHGHPPVFIVGSIYDTAAPTLSTCSVTARPCAEGIDRSEYESAVTDAEFTVIQEMVSCLEPLKLVVNALCRRDTNLVSAEAALKFCIVQLQKQRSELAKTLAEVLESRIKERCGQHSAVMQ